MHIIVNNQPKELAQDAVLQELLVSLEIATNGIAVAINNTVIPKSDWNVTTLNKNDNVMIIQATQGG